VSIPLVPPPIPRPEPHRLLTPGKLISKRDDDFGRVWIHEHWPTAANRLRHDIGHVTSLRSMSIA
jgi:hypothetical protein